MYKIEVVNIVSHFLTFLLNPIESFLSSWCIGRLWNMDSYIIFLVISYHILKDFFKEFFEMFCYPLNIAY